MEEETETQEIHSHHRTGKPALVAVTVVASASAAAVAEDDVAAPAAATAPGVDVVDSFDVIDHFLANWSVLGGSIMSHPLCSCGCCYGLNSNE